MRFIWRANTHTRGCHRFQLQGSSQLFPVTRPAARESSGVCHPRSSPVLHQVLTCDHAQMGTISATGMEGGRYLTTVAPKGSTHSRYAQVWKSGCWSCSVRSGETGWQDMALRRSLVFQLVCPKGDRPISCVNTKLDAKQKACQTHEINCLLICCCCCSKILYT